LRHHPQKTGPRAIEAEEIRIELRRLGQKLLPELAGISAVQLDAHFVFQDDDTGEAIPLRNNPHQCLSDLPLVSLQGKPPGAAN